MKKIVKKEQRDCGWEVGKDLEVEAQRISNDEKKVQKQFIETKRLAKALEECLDTKAFRKKLTAAQEKLLDLYLEEGAAAVLRVLLIRIGRFFRTTDGELLFHRHADHRLYDMEER